LKIVAISQRVDHYPDRNETRDALDQSLANFVTICGYVPVPIPNSLGGVISELLGSVHPAAIVLSGGNDIGVYAERDNTEHALLTYAGEHQLPVLGICRGMQMMANWAGTGLRSVEGHVKLRHRLFGEITRDVNSYHGFSLKSRPNGFKILAKSEDGEIEAIRHQSLPWEGWMWHPERENPFMTGDIQRVKALFS
tara:strand:+ start:1474 stop:2058 length:585 start_codon:yes stop_codon:yes gene_type:complete